MVYDLPIRHHPRFGEVDEIRRVFPATVGYQQQTRPDKFVRREEMGLLSGDRIVILLYNASPN